MRDVGWWQDLAADLLVPVAVLFVVLLVAGLAGCLS